MFDTHSAHPYRNYAIPDDQARPDAGQVEVLIAAFTAQGRTPRLEYPLGLCPAVEPALLAAGFTAERRLAVMACARGEVLDVGWSPLARDATSGEPAGSGLLTTPHEGVSALAAVGVREPFRRQGIVAALTVLRTQLRRSSLAE